MVSRSYYNTPRNFNGEACGTEFPAVQQLLVQKTLYKPRRGTSGVTCTFMLTSTRLHSTCLNNPVYLHENMSTVTQDSSLDLSWMGTLLTQYRAAFPNCADTEILATATTLFAAWELAARQTRADNDATPPTGRSIAQYYFQIPVTLSVLPETLPVTRMVVQNLPFHQTLFLADRIVHLETCPDSLRNEMLQHTDQLMMRFLPWQHSSN